MTAVVPSVGPTLIGCIATTWLAPTTKAKVPFGPMFTAAVGIVMAFARVSSVSRTFTSWPGNRRSAVLSKRAFILTEPVVGSTRLSAMPSSPAPSEAPVSWLNACVANGLRKPSDTFDRR